MTAEMRALLERRMAAKVEELTVAIPAALGEHRSDAEYEELVRRQRELGREIQWLGVLISGLVLVGPGLIHGDRVGFGSRVTLKDLRTGEEDSYTLVAGELLDVVAGQISIESPVGAALVGRRPGEEVRVATPRGERRLRILTLSTLPEQLAREEEGEGELRARPLLSSA